jgi:hypothetical protein
MEFFLPQNLQTQLISYDPTLKSLARAAGTTSKSTKPKFPLGQPYDIIPTSVIKTSLVQNAIDLINAEPVERRVHTFQSRVGDIYATSELITSAILYHYESCWYAAWLPPKGQESEYIYGYAYTYKNTATARNMVPYTVKNNLDNCNFVTYGRSEFVSYQKYVTKEDIIGGDSGPNWALASISWKKGQSIRPVIDNFIKSLKKTIPVWEDRHIGGIFQRLKDTSWLSLLDLDRIVDGELKLTWKPSVESLFKIIDDSVHHSGYNFSTYRKYAKIRHIIDKPFFRKWIQVNCDECIERFTNTENTSRNYVSQPWEQIQSFFDSICYINEIWPDCPVDYYQTHAEELTCLHSLGNTLVCTDQWLRKNMPVASFFHMLAKFMADEKQKSPGILNCDLPTRLTRRYFTDWRDTTAMIGTVLAADKTLEVPKRWRLTEFHDHVQAEAWKVEHTNQSLPQDLFPAPVKVQVDEQTWTFLQPIDLHQLAAWGQAVRNCVGNAKHYAEEVKKKKNFIVLAMVDHKPVFTIQLEVNNGMMSVKQIKGVANQSLSESEKDAYTKAFGTALKKRNEELVLNPA